MAATAQRYSLANPPPTDTPLTGRETLQEAEILEVQSLQAERQGNDALCVQLMERAMQIRSRVVALMGDQLQSYAGTEAEEACYSDYTASCSGLYDCAERLVVKCNSFGVESFKRGDYDTAAPLLQYGLDLTEEDAYPLREDEPRRRHLRGVTLNNLGCMQRRQGHFREALANIQASMDTTGIESPVAYMNMSAILIQLRLGEEAAHMAQRAIELLAHSQEDPSLLAVAHHNLAMALEPMDPVRCLQEYQTAHQTACSVSGVDSPTAQSILRNWQRYQRTHQNTGAGAITHNFVALRGGAGAHGSARRTASPGVGTPIAVEDGGSDIFPHPFVSSQVGQRQAAVANSVPLYHPRAPPRLSTGAGHGTASGKRFTNTSSGATPPRLSQGPAGGSAAVAAPRRPSSQPAAGALSASTGRQSLNPRLRRQANETTISNTFTSETSTITRKAATQLTGQVQRNSPPASRPSAAQDRLQRFTASRNSQDTGSAAQQSYIAEVSTITSKKKGVANATAHLGPSTSVNNGSYGTVAQTFPGPNSRGKLSPLKSKKSSPGRARPEVNNYMSDSVKKDFLEGANRSTSRSKVPSLPPRALPPIATDTDKAANKGKTSMGGNVSSNNAAAGYDGKNPVPFAGAKEVSQFEKKGGDLVEYVADRLDMLLHDEEELERKYRKAVVIQRHFRGHLARRRLGEVRERRYREERLRAIRRSMAARTIQRGVRAAMRGNGGARKASHRRPFLGGRGGAEHAAAVKIQSRARGWLARRDFQRRQKYARESAEAAPRIQRWYRCRVARRELEERRRARDAAEAAAREHERVHYAATRIQSTWRGHREKQRRRDELALRRQARDEAEAARRFHAARAIQCAWRSRQARIEYNHRLSKHLAREAQRKAYQQSRSAAITLQAFARGILTRRRTAPDLEQARFRAAAAVNKTRRTNIAATMIQNAYRGHRARQELVRLRAEHNTAVRAARLRVLAHLLQRVGRAFVARRRLGQEVADMEKEAARYHYQLAELQRHDAHRAAAATQAQAMETTFEDEDDGRAEVEMAEAKARRQMRAALQETKPMRAPTPPPVPALPTMEQREPRVASAASAAEPATEESSQQDLFFHTPPRGTAAVPAAEASDALTRLARAHETLEGFAKIVKSKQAVAERQAALTAYLDTVATQDEDVRQAEAAAVIARFLRSVAASRAVQARSAALGDYLAAREASETGSVDEPGEEDPQDMCFRDKDPSSPTRPASANEALRFPGTAPVLVGVTAEQAESTEPNRAAADTAAAAKDGGDDDSEYESLEAALAAERAKRLAQRAEEERLRKAHDDLINARQAYKMKKIEAATTAVDLAPYARERIDPRRFKRSQANTTAMQSSSSLGGEGRVLSSGAGGAASRPSSRELRERAAGAVIYRVLRGHQARQYARRVRALRDEYLSLLLDRERVYGPVLNVERVTALAGAYPPPSYRHAVVSSEDVSATERQVQEREAKVATARRQRESPAARAANAQADAATAERPRKVQKEAEERPKQAQTQETASTSPSRTVRLVPRLVEVERALAPRSRDEVLASFVKTVEAKHERSTRQCAVAARLQAEAEQDRRACAAEVILHFMRLVAAKAERRRMAEAVEQYLGSHGAEDRRRSATEVIAGFLLFATAKHRAAKRSAAVQSYLDTLHAAAAEDEEQVAFASSHSSQGSSPTLHKTEAEDETPFGQPASSSITSCRRRGSSTLGASLDAVPPPVSAEAATAPATRVSSALPRTGAPADDTAPGTPGNRPKTAEEIEAETAALNRLSQKEQIYVEVEEETEALGKLAKREEELCEVADILEGFVKVIHAKRETALRRASVQAHLDSLQAEDTRDQGSHSITNFMRMAAAKGRAALRAEAVAQASESTLMEELSGTSAVTTENASNASSGSALAMDGVPGAATQSARKRVPTPELVAREHKTLEALAEREGALCRALTPPEVVAERAQLDEIALRLAEEEERCVLERLTAEEEELVESALLDDLALQEAHLQLTADSETALSTCRVDEDDDTAGSCELPVSEDVATTEAMEDADTKDAASAMSEDTAATVLAGFAKVIEAKRSLQDRQDAVRAHLDSQFEKEDDYQEEAEEEEEEEDEEEDPFAASVPSSVSPAEVETAAAVKIQRCFRGLLARRELEVLRGEQQQRLETELMAEELLNGAAMDIQRTFRGYMGRKEARERAMRRQAHLDRLASEAAEAQSCSEDSKASWCDTTSSSANDLAPNAAEDSTIAPSSRLGGANHTGSSFLSDPPQTPRGLREHEVAAAFPERYRELGEPHAALAAVGAVGRTSSSGPTDRRPSGSDSTAIVEEVTSETALMGYDREL